MEKILKLQQKQIKNKPKRLMNPSMQSKPTSPNSILNSKLILGTGKEETKILIKAQRFVKLTIKGIEAIEKDLTSIKGITKNRLGKIFKIVFHLRANKSFTKKGILVRMGKGKGKIIDSGTILFPNQICIELKSITHPINLKVVIKLLEKFVKKYNYFVYQIF